MRRFYTFCLTVAMLLLAGTALAPCAFAQSDALDTPPPGASPAPPPSVVVPPPAGPDIRIEWEVKNRFRLFRSEGDFQHHVAAARGDGVLAAEDRMERESDGRGWARTMVARLCVDLAGKLLDTCDRDGERESYLAPQDHRVAVVLAGAVPAHATCAWTFDDGGSPPRQASGACEEDMRLRVTYGKPTVATVDITAPDGTAQRATGEILVRDLLIAGLGDSIASGEGDPDRPVALDDGGFCFRRFLAGGRSEYFRPGRAGYRGDKACDSPRADTGAAASTGGGAAEWARRGARWLSAACHRSLYGYQMRTALGLAVENPHIAVTFLPLACSGARIDQGFFNSQRANECGLQRGGCAASVPAQLTQLQQALASARKQGQERKLDLVLLTIGANDIAFSGLVADVMIEAATERVLFNQAGLITSVTKARDALDHDLPAKFAKLRAALKPLVGGDLARVVFTSYGHPALQGAGVPCPGGRSGFDVHPAFNVDPTRLRDAAEFVSREFLPKLASLARCEHGVICEDLDRDRMTFVDAHQAAFAEHGFCAQAQSDPVFDRECFSSEGASFEPDPATAATDPLACPHRASEFRPYLPRARWIRTANDSYFTAMTYPESLPATMQPSDIHDATWGATSAVYGGAIHPTAEGHAAMADAALTAARAVLGLPAAATVTAEPLAPVMPGPASAVPPQP